MSFSANVHYGPAASGRVVSKKRMKIKKSFVPQIRFIQKLPGYILEGDDDCGADPPQPFLT